MEKLIKIKADYKEFFNHSEKLTEIKTGFEELFNHVVLGKDAPYVLYGTTKCCATGTCDHRPPSPNPLPHPF